MLDWDLVSKDRSSWMYELSKICATFHFLIGTTLSTKEYILKILTKSFLCEIFNENPLRAYCGSYLTVKHHQRVLLSCQGFSWKYLRPADRNQKASNRVRTIAKRHHLAKCFLFIYSWKLHCKATKLIMKLTVL